MTRPKVSEVFTPRSADVNPAMYVRRPEHERDLKRSVEGSLHTLICGESGSGKSWLYRHVATSENWCVFYANAGNAARSKSVTEAIALALFPDGSQENIELTQKVSAKAEALVISGSTEAQRKYEIRNGELLLRAFKSARAHARTRTAVLVIDNLEAIFGKSDLMEELGNIILLLDDPDYAKHKVKILVVGIPTEVVEYFHQIENLEAVSNRLQEIPAVRSLVSIQITELVRRGFIEQLKVELSPFDLKEITSHLEDVTLGIAQRVHEYCESLGHRIEDNGWKFNPKLFSTADGKYLLGCLRKSYAVVEAWMNERRTTAGRRNQVLFALSKMQQQTFDAQLVEQMVRTEFPISTAATTLAVGQILAELAGGEHPLLRRNSKGASYRFADPRLLMCLRIVLIKNEQQRVVMRPFRR